MKFIGITGGIGSGKSAAGIFFESHKVTVIDADQLAKDALNINTPGFNYAIEIFGLSILDSSGHIDREALRAIVFNDPDKKITSIDELFNPIKVIIMNNTRLL